MMVSTYDHHIHLPIHRLVIKAAVQSPFFSIPLHGAADMYIPVSCTAE